jgi:hypothetical protein
MLDLLYELPDGGKDGTTYEITVEMVESDSSPNLFAAQKRKKESA